MERVFSYVSCKHSINNGCNSFLSAIVISSSATFDNAYKDFYFSVKVCNSYLWYLEYSCCDMMDSAFSVDIFFSAKSLALQMCLKKRKLSEQKW